MKLAQDKNKRKTVAITVAIEPDATPRKVTGRCAWTLRNLMRAGPKGCETLHLPALRWSQYIHLLRKDGFQIETQDAVHGGDFPGHHARYVLQSQVRLIEDCDVLK